MGKNHDLQTLIARKLEGIITQEESGLLEEMLSSSPEAMEEYTIMEGIWKTSQDLKIPFGSTPQLRWERLQSQMNTVPTRKASPTWLRYAAVVSIFLMISLTWLLVSKDEWITIANDTKNAKSVTLLDSSIVKLGVGSTLSYNYSDWDSDRKIHLDGEAFFDVKRNGQSFVVESSNAVITVLGTSFTINSTPQRTVVTCFTGKVSVAPEESDQVVVLTRGLQTIVEANLVAKPFPASERTEQIDNLNFKNAPLSSVFQSLGKHHGTSIALSVDVAGVSFTGNLKETSLESALRTVCLSAGLVYKLDNDSVVISRP